jgi:hypothetical protein
MESVWREAVSAQFGAALDMLENAVAACPDELWGARDSQPEFWHLAYHTLFWTDLYLSGTSNGFAPPPPFTLDERDPDGAVPPRAYEKTEILSYLSHCRDKAVGVIDGLSEATMSRSCVISAGRVTYAEVFLYNLRHIQHGAGQLNLLLRQGTQAAPRWVGRSPLDRGSRSPRPGAHG